MDGTRQQLKMESEKWLQRIKERIKTMKILKPSKELDTVIENLNAYIKDCDFFLEKKDFVRAFESVVYAWGILETCEHLSLLTTSQKT